MKKAILYSTALMLSFSNSYGMKITLPAPVSSLPSPVQEAAFY